MVDSLFCIHEIEICEYLLPWMPQLMNNNVDDDSVLIRIHIT